jgi:hypothetical protein
VRRLRGALDPPRTAFRLTQKHGKPYSDRVMKLPIAFLTLLASLRSLCMTRVNVSRAAIDHLKSVHQAKFKRKRPLGIGHRQIEKKP